MNNNKKLLINIKARIDKDYEIHKYIIEAHDVCPVEWHKGNMNALKEISILIEEKIKELN